MMLINAFRHQAASCAALGSPFMERLLTLLAEKWPMDSKIAKRFAKFGGDIGPAGHSLPLRIASGLHALVLTRRAPELVAVYPPQTPTDAELSEAVLNSIDLHADFLVDWVESPPQTNEVRRSAALIAGARVAVSHFDLPVHLSELGASGGLNLMWDHYALELGGKRFGPSMPVLSLSPEWIGPTPLEATPRIAARAGVDLNPLDPRRADHLLRLTAYLWPDQPERLSLTRSAASVMTAQIDKGDAVEWLRNRLSSAPQGRLHLVQHSVAWQYFPAQARATGTAMLEEAGTRATRDRPLAWLAMESDGDTTSASGAAVTLRLWPGNITMVLGRADFHGRWIKWAHDGVS
ncbi:DUF2332 domain-containing protein [Sulfitobacter guttiformis]|uniref:DUF2332 family protein n=1 Tax=Sulfitobacter guttiformis TaxID=74349 RepID=A0A420DPY0_9RHOB|nr:DUF2332 family protein [Sulfitobacter guttiformis]KIN73571.1 hypothetical protein Z949_2763 [Sulfitobacter guttiformis KCTC 32187]RKE96219.1 hypothetical protein C8N30_0776 [Sulfitobacter guttiformis]